MAQRAKLVGLQSSAFEQTVEKKWEIEGVGVASRWRQLDAVLFDAAQRRAEGVIALANRCPSGLRQGHVVLQEMGRKQQFHIAGRDGFGSFDHTQGFNQLDVRTQGKAQTEAWQAKFF